MSNAYVTLTVSEEDLQRMEKDAEKLKTPEGMLEFLEGESRMSLLIASHIMKKAKGRSGPNHALRAMEMMEKMSTAALQLRQAIDEQGRKQSSELDGSGDGQSEAGDVRPKRPGARETDVPGEGGDTPVELRDGKRPAHWAAASVDEGREGQEKPSQTVSEEGLPESPF